MANTIEQGADNKILKRVRGKGRGSIVFQSDFADCGTPSAIKSAFHRLYTEQLLLRLAHGIYYYPKEDKELGLGVVYPSVEEIAMAIAKRDKAKIVPMGAYALHRLGLSTQVPMNVVFLTSGAPRRINVGTGRGILFKHSSAGKNFAYRSELMMLIVTAMRAIGKEKLSDDETSRLKGMLERISESDFEHDIKLAPAWVRKILMSE
ncbi:MAG: DUF6088 family protein [Bacteroidales bacterium]|nr:DUF6088 family protein [Bacteroidales bacterium]